MVYYELYNDEGRNQLLVRDEPLSDFDTEVYKVMEGMTPARLIGKREDWFSAVVDEVCKALQMKKVVGRSINVSDCRSDLEESRRQDYKP